MLPLCVLQCCATEPWQPCKQQCYRDGMEAWGNGADENSGKSELSFDEIRRLIRGGPGVPLLAKGVSDFKHTGSTPLEENQQEVVFLEHSPTRGCFDSEEAVEAVDIAQPASRCLSRQLKQGPVGVDALGVAFELTADDAPQWLFEDDVPSLPGDSDDLPVLPVPKSSSHGPGPVWGLDVFSGFHEVGTLADDVDVELASDHSDSASICAEVTTM
mmetsp:Transcript_22949/g.53691  ORF Transcript_22949/g.53691 Transcript_22949/m.53691 type:complete len:215 (+) Transcript_22949:78-722(+)